jgi:hypothetical protein
MASPGIAIIDLLANTFYRAWHRLGLLYDSQDGSCNLSHEAEVPNEACSIFLGCHCPNKEASGYVSLVTRE